MAEDLYCNRGDVFAEVPIGELTERSGYVASALATSNILTFDGHGFETNDQVKVRAIEGGTLSAPLVEGTVYFAIRLTSSTFQLATAADGSAIDLTTDGTSVVVSKEVDIDRIIEYFSRWADLWLPAHAVPLGRTEPVHPIARRTVAKLSAYDYLGILGKDSARAKLAFDEARDTLKNLRIGSVPLRGAATPPSTNLATTASASGVLGSCPSGWGGTIP